MSRFPVDAPKRGVLRVSTLRTICAQAGIPREDFVRAYEGS